MTRDRNDWTRELKRFSDRNAGRSTGLEVDAADLGAQREASGMNGRTLLRVQPAAVRTTR